MIKSLSNSQILTEIDIQNRWFNIIPSISINGGYHIDNNSSYPYFNFSISKEIIDIDNFINSYLSIDNYKISKSIEREIQWKDYVSSVINAYAELLYYTNKIIIIQNQILNNINLTNLILNKIKNKKETILNIEKLSNIINILQDDLNLANLFFIHKLEEFMINTGLKDTNFNFELNLENLDFELNSEILDNIINNNQNSLQIKLKYLSITNNKKSIEKKYREIYLPIITINLSFGYDFLKNNYNYSANASYIFPIFDIPKKLNEINSYNIQNNNLNEEISNIIINNFKTYLLMKSQVESLSKKIFYFTKNQEINTQLFNKYIEEYQSNTIDFFELNRRNNQIYQENLELIKTKIILFIIIKRFKYGILDAKIYNNFNN